MGSPITVYRPNSNVIRLGGGSRTSVAGSPGGGGSGGVGDIFKFFKDISQDRDNREILRIAGIKDDVVDRLDRANLSALAGQVGEQNLKDLTTSGVNKQAGEDFQNSVEENRRVADAEFQGIGTGGEDDQASAWRSLTKMFQGPEQPGIEGPSLNPMTRQKTQEELERPPNAFGSESLNNAQGFQSQTANTFDGSPEALGRFLQTDRFKEGLAQAQGRDKAEIARDKSVFDSGVTTRQEIAKGNREIKTEIKSSFDKAKGVNVYKRFDTRKINGKVTTETTNLDEDAAVQSMALDFGLGKLTKSARETSMKTTNERLIESGDQINRLKNIGGVFDPSFVTTTGRFKAKVYGVYDSIFGLDSKSDAADYLKKRTKFKRQTNRAFTEFKVQMTGMAAAVVEIDDLKDQFLNEASDGRVAFESALKDMLQLQEDMQKIDTTYLNALEDKVRPSDAIKIRQNAARAILKKRGITFTASEKLEASQSDGNPALKKLQAIYKIIPGATQ